MQNLKNKRNGITLIALVITIIVLLILAVVSFRIITGDNGIMNKAESSVSETEKAKAKEQVELFISKQIADYYESGHSGSLIGHLENAFKTNGNNGVQIGNYFVKKKASSSAKIESLVKVASLEGAYASVENSTLEIEIHKGTSSQGKLILEGTINATGKVQWRDVSSNEQGGGQTEPEEPETYTVTYNTHGANENIEADTNISSGEAVTLPEVTKDGYTFNGWYDAETEGNKIGNAGASYTVNENITLHAQWTAVPTYTVSYNANGGRGDIPESQTGKTNDVITINTTAQPIRNSYVFLGWNTSNSASEAMSTVTIASENVTLYAVWRQATQAEKAAHPEWHIPTGFQYLTGNLDTGYVITDSTASNKSGGNEFVWIPVASEAAYAKKAGTKNWHMTAQNTDDAGRSIAQMVAGDVLGVSSILETSVTSTLANQPEKAIVCSAGGFWIGRYEAGSNSTADASTINWNTQEIVEKEGVQPVRNIYQSVALSRANNWSTGKTTTADGSAGTVAWQSGLITGTQWDVMCEYIGWSTCNTDCSSWGNYYNVASGSYSGLRSQSSDTTWESGLGQKNANTYSIFPTGVFSGSTVSNTAKKNIYDVAGNVWEWTTERPVNASGSNIPHGVLRGGSAYGDGSDHLATYRSGGYEAETRASWTSGFRLVLYVQ